MTKGRNDIEKLLRLLSEICIHQYQRPQSNLAGLASLTHKVWRPLFDNLTKHGYIAFRENKVGLTKKGFDLLDQMQTINHVVSDLIPRRRP